MVLKSQNSTYKNGLSTLVDSTRTALGGIKNPPKVKTPQDRMYDLYLSMNADQFNEAVGSMGIDGAADWIEAMEQRRIDEEVKDGN